MTAAFRLDLPFGRCVGVSIPVDDDAAAELPADERARAAELAPLRRPAFLAGRVALRAALADLGIPCGAVLATPRGAPALPVGLTASISHKATLAVALAAPRDGDFHVGVDIEEDRPGRIDIASHVLTPAEQTELAALPEPERRRQTLLRFSIKEALYKALDPYLGRFVHFTEATTAPRFDGQVTVSIDLREPSHGLVAAARWRVQDGHLLSCARVIKVADAGELGRM